MVMIEESKEKFTNVDNKEIHTQTDKLETKEEKPDNEKTKALLRKELL